MKNWIILLTLATAPLFSQGLSSNKLYILMGRSGTITVKDPVLSLYTLTLKQARQQIAELPPSRVEKSFTISTGTVIEAIRTLPVTSYTSKISFQTDNSEQKTVSFFEIYSPIYDPIKETISLDFQVFVEGQIKAQNIIDPALFFSVSYIPRTQITP